MKGHVVAYFIVEFTTVEGRGAREHLQWSIHTKGSSNKWASGAGIVLHSPEGDEIKCMVCLDFPTTNNEAKYEASGKTGSRQSNKGYQCGCLLRLSGEW